MPQLQGEADLDVWDHPFMQQQVVSGQLAALPNDAIDPPPPDALIPRTPRRIGTPARLIAATNPNPLSSNRRPGHRLRRVARSVQIVIERCGLQDRARRRSGAHELRCDEVEKWSLPRQDDAAFRDEIGRLQQRLRRPRRHDAG